MEDGVATAGSTVGTRVPSAPGGRPGNQPSQRTHPARSDRGAPAPLTLTATRSW